MSLAKIVLAKGRRPRIILKGKKKGTFMKYQNLRKTA